MLHPIFSSTFITVPAVYYRHNAHGASNRYHSFGTTLKHSPSPRSSRLLDFRVLANSEVVIFRLPAAHDILLVTSNSCFGLLLFSGITQAPVGTAVAGLALVPLVASPSNAAFLFLPLEATTPTKQACGPFFSKVPAFQAIQHG
jgi:hypothetical protein